jgi:hypothetical protein
MKYQPPWNTQFGRPVDDPDASYINANPSAGIEGSVPPAESIEYPQREIVAATQLAGFQPSDDDLEQLTRGIRQGTSYATATVIGGGDPNALYLNLIPKLDAYRPGLCLRVKIPVENTGPVGINIDNLGLKSIVRASGAVMGAADLRANMVADIVYDGNVFQLVNFQGFTSTTTNNNTYVVNVPYCVDLGSANHIIAPFSPPITTLTAGFFCFVKIAAVCTGPTWISVNGLPEKRLLRTDLKALGPRDIITGMVCGMVYDGADFQMVSFPASILRDLVAPMSYYVATTGSDSNDGLTSATPFRHIQYALDSMLLWNNRGTSFNIYIADGTYEEKCVAHPINGSGDCHLIGNVNNPQNVVIWDNVGSDSTTKCLIIMGGPYFISGIKFVSNSGNGLSAGGAQGICQFYNVEFGQCGRSHMECGDSAVMQILGPAGNFIRVSGNTTWHMACFGGTIKVFPPGPTGQALIITTPISANIWCYASVAGVVVVPWYSITGKGNVSGGYKYVAEKNGVIDTNGQAVDYLPNSLAGYTSSGGQYT